MNVIHICMTLYDYEITTDLFQLTDALCFTNPTNKQCMCVGSRWYSMIEIDQDVYEAAIMDCGQVYGYVPFHSEFLDKRPSLLEYYSRLMDVDNVINKLDLDDMKQGNCYLVYSQSE